MVAFVLVGFHADIYSFQRSSTFGIVVVGAYRSGVLLCKQFQPIGSGNWGGYQHSVDDRGAVLGGDCLFELARAGFPPSGGDEHESYFGLCAHMGDVRLSFVATFSG